MNTPFFTGGRLPAAWTMAFAVAFVALVLRPAPAAAQEILPGYELYQTQPGTNFQGLGDLQGVPYGTYSFGGMLGVQNTDNADTIIERTATATPISNVVNFQMVGLQLETTGQVNYNGNGLAYYFLTLQSSHGGAASTGTDTITFNGNTGGIFSNMVDIFYDIRMGSLTGPIVDTGNITLSATDTAWGINAPSGAFLLYQGNYELNGTDTSNDFWAGGLSDEQLAYQNKMAEFFRAATPEPSSWVLALFGAAGLAAVAWRRKAHVRR